MNLKLCVGKGIQAAAVITGLVLLVIIFWLFVIERIDPDTGQRFDGLGRPLRPAIVQPFGRELSPGFMWEVIDTAVAIVVFGGLYYIFNLGRHLKEQGEMEE
jgi:hypothetical protein